MSAKTTMPSTSFLSRSTRPLSSSIIQNILNTSDDEIPHELDFLKIMDLAWSLRLPSIALKTKESSYDAGSKPEHIVLGQGLTSKVTLHVLNKEDKAFAKTQDIVAIKRYTDTSATVKKQRHRVFTTIMNEIKILRRPGISEHPNIAQLHCLVWEKDTMFPGLAMECSTFGSLDQLIRGTWPGFNDVQISSARWHITLDISMGLYAIHEAGITHGDLKPENILLMNSETDEHRVVAKLADFGGSTELSADGVNKPLHHTPLWSAPEILHGDPDVDWMRADVYSFGLVIASLWLAPRAGGGFGIGRAGKINCCVISSIVSSKLTERDEEEFFLYLKSIPYSHLIDATMIDYLKRKADIEGVDEADKMQLIEVLTPILNAHFWLRPDMQDVCLSLSKSAKLIGRCVSKEMQHEPFENVEDSESPKLLDLFSRSQLHVLVPVMAEHAIKTLNNIKNLTSDAIPPDGLEHLLIQGDSNSDEDAGAEPDDSVEILRRLKEAVKTVFLTRLPGESHDEAWDRFTTMNKASFLPIFVAAVTNITDPMSQKGRQTIEDMICWAAMAGNGMGICLATLTIIGSNTEARLPIPYFLVILAVTGSFHASQLLFERYPHLFELSQKLVQDRPSAFDKCKPDYSGLQRNLLPMQSYRIYLEEPSLQSSISASEALDLGLLQPVRDMIQGTRVLEGFDDVIPSLMHGLSSLPDSEAAILAPAALEIGGCLSFRAPATSSVGPSVYFDGTREAYSDPLCAAIRRGKSQLALALLGLHEKTGKPIKDYRHALDLSYLYLQHDVAEALFCWRKKTDVNFEDTDETDLNWEHVVLGMIRDLLYPVPADAPFLGIERRALLGSRFLEAYEKTLKVLVRHGGATILITQGARKSTPLSAALRFEDMVATRTFLEALKKDPEAVTSYLLSESAGNDEDAVIALTDCFTSRTGQTFDLLLQTFPALAESLTGERGRKLIRFLCSANVQCAQTLLKHCPSLKGSNGNTPLSFLLINGNMEGAYSMVENYSATDIKEIVAKDPTDGSSLCFSILENIPRSVRSVQALTWLAERGGIHLYGPSEVPAWFKVVGTVRPNTAHEQRIDARILSLLLFQEDRQETLTLDKWENGDILTHAARNGHLEIVRLLLSKNFDINKGTLIDSYRSKLESASESGSQEQKKYIIRPLDEVLSVLGGAGIPPTVSQGGSLAVQKWTEDLEQIANLFIDKGAKSTLIEKYEEATEQGRPFAENSIALSTFARFGQPVKGMWPAPLPQPPTSPTNDDKSMDNTELVWTKHEVAEEMIANTKRFFYRRNASNNAGKMDPSEIDGLKFKEAKERARRIRAIWRLPPDWQCFGFCDDEQVQRDVDGFYMNSRTLQVSSKKPRLYRGDQTVEEDAAENIRGKAAEDRAGSPEEEMLLEEIMFFMSNQTHEDGSSPPSLSTVVAKIMSHLGRDQNSEPDDFEKIVRDWVRHLKAEILVRGLGPRSP